MKVIDRKKNIFKLAQGEYVAAEKIENLINRTKSIEEAFVYGDSLKSYLIGIFFPKKAYITQKALELQIEYAEFEKLLTNEKIKKEIKKELDEMAKRENFLGFEKVANFSLVPESFAVYGLMTVTFKIKRHEAKVYFKKVIDDLYKQGPMAEKD